MRRKNSQKGNILFILLMAIVLLAVVTFSVTRSARTRSNISTEDATIFAASIMQYGDTLRTGVQTLLANGTPVSHLSFENDYAAGYTNGSATDADKLFNASGGGVSYRAPDARWLDNTQSAQSIYQTWFFPDDVCVESIGSKGTGDCQSDTANNEDVMVILPYIKEEICYTINRRLGIDECSGEICQSVGGGVFGGAKFTGTLSDGVRIQDNGTGTVYRSHPEGCIAANAGGGIPSQPAGTFFYYKVLAER